MLRYTTIHRYQAINREILLEDLDDSDEFEETELVLGFIGINGLGLDFTLLCTLVAAVFIAISLGGGGEEFWSSLSLLLSGLKILFVFDFFESSSLLLEVLTESFGVTFFWATFLGGLSFFGAFFNEALGFFGTGVTVAEDLGLGCGFRLALGFGDESSVSDE